MAGVNQQRLLWEGVLELTMAAQERGTDPLIWATQLSSSLTAAGVSMPSVEVAELLVSHICWSNNIPITWKFLEKALILRIVPPLFVLALLSTRVVSNRRRCPVAYRLYMEFIKRYVFSLPSLIFGPNYNKIMESIGDVLRFRQIYGIHSPEPGHLVVEFILSTVWELLDASLDDEGLLEHTLEKKSRWPIKSQDMEIDCRVGFEGENMEREAELGKMNTVMSIELIGDFFQNKVTSRILYLARRNMPMHWDCFIQHLRKLTANSRSLRNSKNISPEALLQLTSDTRKVLSRACKMSVVKTTSAGMCNGTFRTSVWLPIDLYLEDALDDIHVKTTSVAETLTGLLKALQVLNQTTWQDAFHGLWTAALRLVQREKNPIGGPDRSLNTCLCMLLSIVTLAVVNIVEEEEITESLGKRRVDLASSLQQLDNFEELLTPPPLVSSFANQAAAKAMMFLSGISVGCEHLNDMSLNDMPVNCPGNLRHLIVEACIARNVLDTSAYSWPGYVKGRCNQIPLNTFGQMPGWSSLMKGSPLTPPMISALVSTPATSFAELERMYEITVTGTDDEKISAATILCGASLCRGWNIQEHAGLLITKLLSPAVPINFTGSESHLTGFAPFLNALLVGLSSVDCTQIFSLHGLAPQLAVALMPICEVFGSSAPNMSWTLNSGEVISSHTVFSNAFVLLLKMWRFDQPPVDHVMRDGAPVGSHLNPDHVLSVHNSQLRKKTNRLPRFSYPSPTGPIFMDSFPNLKRWYRKHQECISSILSSLVPENTVHQIVEALLGMMFRKTNKDGQPLTSTTSGSSSRSSSSHVSSGDDERLKISAFDILEAVPFAIDAALSACSHGRLSPRELTTGLKYLADFLPASLTTIFSYYSAEVSRGLWKPAVMNGIDWPSSAGYLSSIEEQIKKVLSATGVNVPYIPIGASSTLTLPLPLAALLSLTITYKLNRVGECYITLVGPSLINLAVRSPWPCMSVVAALWSQKARYWSGFFFFVAAQAVFHHNNDAISQLIGACFSTALGLNSSLTGGGVGAFLGHGFGDPLSGGISEVAPGILYLRVHRAVRNVMLMTEEMVSILMHTVNDIANSGLPEEEMEKLKKTKCGTKYGQVSLAAAMNKVRIAASLGASLVWMAGGLNLIQYLFKEILPSWFICSHGLDPNGQDTGAILGGYALAYFTHFCGLFAWGVDSGSPVFKRRRSVLGKHLEFLSSALDGKILLGCHKTTWRAYVTGYFSLMISCTPNWMLEVDVEVLKRICKGLKRWNEDEMAMSLLGISGIGAMGVAAEMIIETGS